MSNYDFDEYPITEEEVIAILGNYRVRGQELEFQCRGCSGGDTHKDNLKFNRQKHILKCHAGCKFEKEVCEIIARRRYEARTGNQVSQSQPHEFQRREAVEQAPQEEKKKEIAQENLSEYYLKCNYALMSNKNLLKKMYLKHSILPKTACECFIGYDEAKDMLVFPSRAVGKDPTNNQLNADNGAEYREYEGDKVIRRISGYEPAICAVHHGAFTMRAIICEGYKDAYNLLQLLRMVDTETMSHTAIFTVQNGTNSINTNNCLQKVNWHRFETIGILMDNDVAGDKATEVARELFPCMIDLRKELLNEYNDVQDRFAAEYGHVIDIDKALAAEWLEEYEEAMV